MLISVPISEVGEKVKNNTCLYNLEAADEKEAGRSEHCGSEVEESGGDQPGLLKLHLQEVTDGLVLCTVVDGPIDAQLTVLANQLQHGAEALCHVELGVLAALLPGVHGQEL